MRRLLVLQLTSARVFLGASTFVRQSSVQRNFSPSPHHHLSMSYRGGSGRGGRGGGRGGGGRGEYYKNKYGRGRSGRGGGERADGPPRSNGVGGTYADLKRLLAQIDGRQYPAYHDLESSNGWTNEAAGFTLFVGRAQSDPFAPPTRCRLIVSASTAQFPQSLYSNKVRAIALTDYLQRALYTNCQSMGASAGLNGKSWSGPKGGDVQIMEPCQHVLEQSAVSIDPRTGDVCAQVTINLPARGRTVLGQMADEIFDRTLTTLVEQSLRFPALNANRLEAHVDSVEDQHWLQGQLESHNLVAFVRNGAILPRASGVDDRPMTGTGVILFQSPPRLQVSFSLPNARTQISGMGIPKGITLICGGGFHGKSTLLQALQLGVYPKLPGDGREFCVTAATAMKIRAEDGRSVSAVDISPFISNLPFGKDTTCFSTPDASGSTSQASNIVEVSESCVEYGSIVYLPSSLHVAMGSWLRWCILMPIVATSQENGPCALASSHSSLRMYYLCDSSAWTFPTSTSISFQYLLEIMITSSKRSIVCTIAYFLAICFIGDRSWIEYSTCRRRHVCHKFHDKG